MKKLFIITATFVCAHTFLSAQKAMTFDEARESKIRVSQLDSNYKSAVHTDPALAVFSANQREFIDAYQQMLQDFGKALKAHGVLFGKPVQGFNRIYFTADGKIDYYIYSLRPGQISPEQEKEFHKELGKFIKDYRFPLKAPVKFAQCSPVTFLPTAADK